MSLENPRKESERMFRDLRRFFSMDNFETSNLFVDKFQPSNFSVDKIETSNFSVDKSETSNFSVD